MNTKLDYTVYIAGKMRCLPRFGFDAFFEAEDTIIRHLGWNVLNPARADQEDGFDPNTADPFAPIDPVQCERFFDRDVAMIKSADGLVMLPTWKHSIGAQAEYFIGQWLQKEIHFYDSLLKEVAFCP